MSYVLNQFTAPDNYAAASTVPGAIGILDDLPIEDVTIDVSNQAIFWQVKIPTSGNHGVWDTVESYMIPGSRRITGDICGIRVRAAIPLASLPAGTAQAVVTVRAE